MATVELEPIGRVLVAFDGSEPAVRALMRAIAMVPADGFLAVIHVVPRLAPGVRPGHAAEPAALDAQRRILAEAKAVVPQTIRSRTQWFAACGKVAGEIVARAREFDAGLIVIGTRGLGGAGRWLLGSVSEAVAHNAACDVWLVR